MLFFVQEAIARGKTQCGCYGMESAVGETEIAVARAMKDFEAKAAHGDILKLADYIRLLDGLRELFVESPARMTLRWTDKWEQITSNEQ